MTRTALALSALLLASGCSSKMWYESVREAGRQQCKQTPDTDAARDCADKLGRQTYEGYKAEREKPASPVLTK
jgi:hypothetical protein